MPNRKPLYFVGALLFALIVTFGAGYSVGRGSASAEALAANRRADSLVVVIAERETALSAALAASALTTDKVDALVARTTVPKARVRSVNVAALPDTCKPIVQTILADAETVFVVDSTALLERDAQVTRLTNELVKAEDLLFETRGELAKQALRTQAPPPKKLLGLIPMPTLHGGYGGTYSEGKLHTGPTMDIGWTVKF